MKARAILKRLLKPLNEMNLDQPGEKLVYEELAPLVKRLNAQQREIAAQRAVLQRRRDEFEAATRHMREGIILLFNHTYELQDVLQRA